MCALSSYLGLNSHDASLEISAQSVATSRMLAESVGDQLLRLPKQPLRLLKPSVRLPNARCGIKPAATQTRKSLRQTFGIANANSVNLAGLRWVLGISIATILARYDSQFFRFVTQFCRYEQKFQLN